MFKSYLKIAFRNFIKERFYSTLNVLGLAVGITVVLLISLFCLHELSYDRFHQHYKNIYRMAMHLEISGNSADLNSTFPPYGKVVKEQIPYIDKVVRMIKSDGRIFKKDQSGFSLDNVMYVDEDFFQVFDFDLLIGNKQNLLTKRNAVVLTSEVAEKLFQTRHWDDVVGQSILINDELHEVTGVAQAAPANSHIEFTALVSLQSLPQGRDESWNNINLSAYALLSKNVPLEKLTTDLQDVLIKNLGGVERFEERKKEGLVMEMIAQPLADIHLRSSLQGEFKPGGNITTIYIFAVVGLIVLLLACVNFVNLVTARSANRAKEVGVRKVLGSAASLLQRQFIIECIFFVFISTIIALGAIELLRRPFHWLIGFELPFHLLLSPLNLLWLLCFVVVLGVLAGSYPAFYLSRFKPSEVLKGQLRAGMRGGSLRNGLVILQFSISIVLITCTLIVQRQLDYMRSVRLGFDKDNVIIIDNSTKLPSQQAYLDAIRALPMVKLAGVATHRPVDDYDGMLITSEDDKEHNKLVHYSRVDYDYLKVINYEVAAGRLFSREFPSDTAAVVINERAARLLFDGDPIGKTLDNGIQYKVIGVVKDFNFESLKNNIKPLVFYLHPHQQWVHVRIEPGDYATTIAALETEWKKQSEDIPFVYSFLDETYDNLYKQEIKLGTLFSIFTGLTLFIACLGLVGLAAYTAQQKRKEISVRKVLGASVSVIVVLLSKQFFRLVLISCFIAVPIAYLLMNEWLKSFAFQTTIPFYILLCGGLVVMIIALAAVSYQSIRAGLTNPVDSLKQE